MFEKILIANRGEIAVRITRTLKKLGISTVAIYSDSDFRSLHVTGADEAYHLGGDRPAESYLAKEKIIEIALKSGCQAIHPGYGFLSENEQFARMVEKCGLKFIGPSAQVIALLGDKIEAKKKAVEAGVPIVPGRMSPIDSDEAAFLAAKEIGYPILLKPAAGGGGKGMRIVHGPEGLSGSLKTCRQETQKSFGDDTIFIERYIEKPRHIEIQILADEYGNVVHLGERECSIQRRYQKIIEESPSTAVGEKLRDEMGKMACNLARNTGYVNAGTVEFILDSDMKYYFLEMNTRLQVEHPVTEMITSLDLVELQLKIAAGEILPLTQEDIHFSGCAIEARICAEDTTRNFTPSAGLITRYAQPYGKNLRTDSGVDAGSYINVFYDPMIAKLIVWGETRETARKHMIQALNAYHVEGVMTNVDFVNRILTHPAFIKGDLSTDFIPKYILNEDVKLSSPSRDLHFMAIATTLIFHLREELIRKSLLPLKAKVGSTAAGQKASDYMAKSENDIFSIRLFKGKNDHHWRIRINDVEYRVQTPPMEFYRRRLKLDIGGESYYFRLRYAGNFIEASFNGTVRTFEIYEPREWELAKFMPVPVKKESNNLLECPMPGLIVDVKVKPGDRVFRGQELLTIESMKMESSVSSPCEGVIEAVSVKPGDAVDTGMILISFKI